MIDASSSPGANLPRSYSRDELMSWLGLTSDEIDALLAHAIGPEARVATLCAILNHLRSIYDLAEDRIPGFLKRHHQTFDGPPLNVMLSHNEGADRVQRYLASEVYSTW